MDQELEPVKKPPEDDCIEPEIVSGPGSGGKRAEYGRPHGAGRPPSPEINPFYTVFLRIKFIFTAAVLLAAFGLLAVGAILTSTVIGALIGVPLMLLGMLLLWLLFKLLMSGKKNDFVVFKRF